MILLEFGKRKALWVIRSANQDTYHKGQLLLNETNPGIYQWFDILSVAMNAGDMFEWVVISRGTWRVRSGGRGDLAPDGSSPEEIGTPS